jgi:Putative transposase of IS4/5 family (DUF4096)
LPARDGKPEWVSARNRLFFDAVLWVARTGVPWRDLPARFGRWNAVWRARSCCATGPLHDSPSECHPIPTRWPLPQPTAGANVLPTAQTERHTELQSLESQLHHACGPENIKPKLAQVILKSLLSNRITPRLGLQPAHFSRACTLSRQTTRQRCERLAWSTRLGFGAS